LLIWVSSLVIAIGTAARQIPMERENRTIFPLLAKPVTRGQVIAGKFAGCWLACGIVLLVFYTFFTVVVGSREGHWPLGATLQAMLLQWVMLGWWWPWSCSGRWCLRRPSSNSTICFIVIVGILLLGRHLNQVALQQPEPVQTVAYTVYFLIRTWNGMTCVTWWSMNSRWCRGWTAAWRRPTARRTWVSSVRGLAGVPSQNPVGLMPKTRYLLLCPAGGGVLLARGCRGTAHADLE